MNISPLFKEIFPNVFSITFDQINYGSSFTLPIRGCLYFVTAAHLVQNGQENKKVTFYIYEVQELRRIEAELYFLEEDLDLVVIKTNMPANSAGKENSLILSCKNLIMGQDVFVLGFPNTLRGKSPSYEQEQPFVKRVGLAGIHGDKLLLDNPIPAGFSGGPVVCWDHIAGRPSICGVYSSLLFKTVEITQNKAVQDSEECEISVAYNISFLKKAMSPLFLKGSYFVKKLPLVSIGLAPSRIVVSYLLDFLVGFMIIIIFLLASVLIYIERLVVNVLKLFVGILIGKKQWVQDGPALIKKAFKNIIPLGFVQAMGSLRRKYRAMEALKRKDAAVPAPESLIEKNG